MYTNRLKTMISLDITLIIALPALRAIYEINKLGNRLPYLTVATIFCALWVTAKLMVGSKYWSFNDIWFMFPSKLSLGIALTAVSLILGPLFGMDYNNIGTCLFVLLLGYMDLKKDRYALRQAQLFEMDKISSLRDLVEQYPDAFFMLKRNVRKQLRTEADG